jgi:hypothetical protein
MGVYLVCVDVKATDLAKGSWGHGWCACCVLRFELATVVGVCVAGVWLVCGWCVAGVWLCVAGVWLCVCGWCVCLEPSVGGYGACV